MRERVRYYSLVKGNNSAARNEFPVKGLGREQPFFSDRKPDGGNFKFFVELFDFCARMDRLANSEVFKKKTWTTEQPDSPAYRVELLQAGQVIGVSFVVKNAHDDETQAAERSVLNPCMA